METNAKYIDCLCRTCMNKVEASSHDGNTISQHQWLSIFDTIEECAGFRIAELLSDAVPQIVVQPSDELPTKICTECLQRLLSVYRFQQMCVQSDKKMHELLSKKDTVLKTPMLEEAIKGETEINEEDSQPLKDSTCNTTLQNLQQPSIQESLAEVTIQTIEQDAAQSSVADHLQDNTQLLEHCNDSQGEFEAFIKNEPIEDDEANSEYSDGDTMHSTISVTKDEPVELEDEQVNVTSTRHNCHLCNKSYKKSKSLKKHLNNHKKKANNRKEYCYACHLCSESYSGLRYLSRHLSSAHSIEPQLTCDVCNKSFASSYGLRLHIRTHTGERPYVCSECGKSFAQQSHLAKHRNIHFEDNRYECSCCPLRFASKAQATHHKKSHEEAAKRYECDICGKKLSSTTTLRKHKLIHSGEKPHKCDFCEKRFALLYELLVHNRRHTGEKPYKCKYCERAYTKKHTLLQHSRRHLGANVHRCKFCPLAFPLDSELRLHLTTHRNEDKETRERNLKALQEEEAKLELKLSKERAERQSTEIHLNKIKRHKCDICGKKFGKKSYLSQHKRTHSNEKPHECDQCGMRFIQSKHLKGHIRTHTGEKPYKCKYCERIYTTSTTLSNHLTSHKNEDLETRERNLKALQEKEAKLKLRFSKEKSKGQSTENQQQQKSEKEIEQPSKDGEMPRQRDSRRESRRQGHAYTTAKGKNISAKQSPTVDVPCKCNKDCKTISHTHRNDLFTAFRKMSTESQKAYVNNLIDIIPVQRRYSSTEKRQISASYRIPNGEGVHSVICKKTFMETFGLSEKAVRTILERKKKGNDSVQEARGGSRGIRFTAEQREQVKSHIMSFPREESHYGREDSSKEFLSADLNKISLFRAFQEKYPESPVSFDSYKRVLTEDFPRLKFGQLRVDTCKTRRV